MRVYHNSKSHCAFAFDQQLAAVRRYGALALELKGVGHPQLRLNFPLTDCLPASSGGGGDGGARNDRGRGQAVGMGSRGGSRLQRWPQQQEGRAAFLAAVPGRSCWAAPIRLQKVCLNLY